MVSLVSSGDGSGKPRRPRKQAPASAQLRIPFTETLRDSAIHLVTLRNLCREWDHIMSRRPRPADPIEERRALAELKHCITKANRLLNLDNPGKVSKQKQWHRQNLPRHE